MAGRKPLHAVRSAATSGSSSAHARVASDFEDVPPPLLPERMRARDSEPASSGDVDGLRDALRSAGVREVQLINSTTRQLESTNRLEATAARLEATFSRVADEMPKLTAEISKLIQLLGSSSTPATQGAYADATPGGRKVTPAVGTPTGKAK